MKTLDSIISWFEIPVTDMGRAINFYNHLFGISLQEAIMGDLQMAVFPVKDNVVGGALCKHKDFYYPDTRGITLYLTADPNIETVLQRVIEAEGTIIMDKKCISPEVGYMALFTDSEGNRIALFEKSN